MKDGRLFPFRWLLPLAQLTFCIAAMWPVWWYLGAHVFQHRQPHSEVRQTFTQTIPQAVFIFIEPHSPEQLIDERRADLPAFLNLPAGFLQVPYAAFSSGKQDWMPKNLDPVISDLFIWRALTWPFLGIIFWWMVGRSIEALLAMRARLVSPRIRWIEVICGLTIGFLSGGLFIMSLMAEPWEEKKLVMRMGSGLWTILGAVIVITFIIQWRLRRRAKNQLQEIPLTSA